MGGIGDFGKGLDDEAARLGISPDELAQKVRYSSVVIINQSRDVL